ncbi:hypothetical protein ACJROX_14170 [Pseudalkalibacillus sp. A8]|uniref:hypothetical protein n=1 Tax=Pseudalkalibacillus sp. A8 TaxID=3382641 RepID=UPI0038B4820A
MAGVIRFYLAFLSKYEICEVKEWLRAQELNKLFTNRQEQDQRKSGPKNTFKPCIPRMIEVLYFRKIKTLGM